MINSYIEECLLTSRLSSTVSKWIKSIRLVVVGLLNIVSSLIMIFLSDLIHCSSAKVMIKS